MAVTDTSLTLPLSPAPAPEPAPRVPAASDTGAPAAASKAAAPPAPSAPVAGSSPSGFALHFDPDTQRMILESADPVTGFVIYRMPPKYAIKQLSASADTSGAARGAKVDSAL